jgi:vacuolar protein sorting-associated protein 45
VLPDNRDVVMSCSSDAFFRKHMYSNFGDVGGAIQELVEAYKAKVKDSSKTNTIADMQRFMESYPELRGQSASVSKHVTVTGELGRIVEQHGLMDLSQLEQGLACDSDHTTHVRELTLRLESPRVSSVDALRLVMLYALRYETLPSNQIARFKGMLESLKGVAAVDIALVDALLAFAGSAKRQGDLFGMKSSTVSFVAKLVKKGLQGVENVYTQHKPVLAETLDALTKGRLKDAAFPFVGGSGASSAKPRDLIVFMLGGTTFEEAAVVADLNAAAAGAVRVVLGGTFMHNSKSFLAELFNISKGGI